MIFGLHTFVGWTAHFALWTAQIGWTARLKYALTPIPRPTGDDNLGNVSSANFIKMLLNRR